MIREKSCGAIIFRRTDDGIKYLLLHYEAGHWDFVKGLMEKRESEKATVMRETCEETGITDLLLVEGFSEHITYMYKKESGLVLKEVIFHLAETKTEQIKLSPEHTAYAWLLYNDARARVTYENARKLLENANDCIQAMVAGQEANPS